MDPQSLILTFRVHNPHLPVAGANYSTYTVALLYQSISLANQKPGKRKKVHRKRAKTIPELIDDQMIDDSENGQKRPADIGTSAQCRAYCRPNRIGPF